jgi:nucleoid DNA-binding protein
MNGITGKISIKTIDTITKSKLVEQTASYLDQDIKDVYNVYDSILTLITSSLKNKTSVMLKNVGTLAVVDKAERKGVRNPKTGEEMILKARSVVKLKHTFKTDYRIITSEIVSELSGMARFSHLTQGVVKACLDYFLKSIIQILNGKTRIELRGFGVFYPTYVKAKWSRNPKTDEKVFVEEKIKLSFNPSKVITLALNN